MQRFRPQFTAAVCLMVALATQSCPAFETVGRSWLVLDPFSPVVLTYSYQNFLDGGLLNSTEQSVPAPQIKTAVEEALQVWADVVPITFVEVVDEGGPINLRPYPRGAYGQIRFGHRRIDGFGNIKAVGYYPPTLGPECNLCGDIHFDATDRWEELGTLVYPDILGAAIHEIGHTLGLGHSDISAAAMFPTFPRLGGPGTGSLHEDDIAGIQWLYGAGAGEVIPLRPIPEPATIAGLGILVLTATCRRRWLPGYLLPS